MKTIKIALLTGTLLGAGSQAQAQVPDLFGPLFGFGGTETTQQFRAEALRSDAFEVESSRMALERSRNPRVKAFARQMIADHSRTTASLLPPGTSLNATGNVVSNEEAEIAPGPLGILVAPFTASISAIGEAFGGAATPGHRVVLDPRRQQMLTDLSTAPGRHAFEARYSGQQVRAHQDAIVLYAEQARNGDDETARTFAGQVLPALQMHLDHAARLDEQVGYQATPSF